MTRKWHKRFLRLAREISGWSKDPSTQVGCVAVKDGRVLAQGYNGFPRGISDTHIRLYNRNQKLKYMVHAETNCIYNACYNGMSLNGSTFYVIGLPVCGDCALGLIQVGVESVVMGFRYEDLSDRWKESCDSAIEKFKEAGVQYQFIEEID